MNDLIGALTLLFVVAGLVVVALFLILRGFMTWYWKQTEQVELLRAIARSVQLLEEQGRPLPPGAAAARAVVLPPSPQASPYATPPWR